MPPARQLTLGSPPSPQPLHILTMPILSKLGTRVMVVIPNHHSGARSTQILHYRLPMCISVM